MVLNLTELFLTLCSWLIWLTPFTFVFFLAHTVREVVRGGEKDVTYGALAGLSLFMLVVAPWEFCCNPMEKAAPFWGGLFLPFLSYF